MNEEAVNRVLRTVKEERKRQDLLKEMGRFKFTPDEVPLIRSFAMLAEELGEVGRDILAVSGYVHEDKTIWDCRKELIQVAAIAVAMVEGIETHESLETLVLPA